MTTLTVDRQAGRGSYLLRDDHGSERATLRVGWPVRRGELRSATGTWTVRRSGRRAVTVEDDGRPIVRLDRGDAMISGVRDRGQWAITRTARTYHGTLTHGSRAIVLGLTALSGRRCTVAVTGDWEERDVVVMAACFALLARRRHDIAMVMAVSGSHGG